MNEKNKSLLSLKNRKILLTVCESFFTVWALMKAGNLQPGNILTGIFFFLCILFYRRSFSMVSDYFPEQHNGSCEYKQLSITAGLLSAIFTLTYMAVDAVNYIYDLENLLFRLLILTATALGFFFLFFHLLRSLFIFLSERKRCMAFLSHPLHAPIKTPFFIRLCALYGRHILLFSFLLCILGFLPYFLYQYPGIMTPDSLNQLEQVLGIIPYNNHHPFVHTMLIKLFYQLGCLFTDNMVTAISFYTFFQLCVMAWSAAWFIQTLHRLHVSKLFCLLIACFYAFVPYNAIFSITIWKDVPFSAGILLFSTAMLRLYSDARKKHFFIFPFIMLILSGCMICLLRTNGWYAYLISLPFLIYFYRKSMKAIPAALLGVFLFTLVIKGPVMNMLDVTQPDLVESLSIPVQQIANVIAHDRELSPVQQELIHSVIDTTYIKELYHPQFADNIKELVRSGNPGYLQTHKGDYLKLWFSLGMSYPLDYLEAYTQQTMGYWYPDSFYTIAENEGISATPLGISHTPLIGGPLVVKAKEISIKLGGMIPLYGLIWSMGILLWLLLCCIGCGIVRKEHWKLFLYLPGLSVMATVLIATPVAVEFRYAYSLVFSFPLYLILAVWIPEEA